MVYYFRYFLDYFAIEGWVGGEVMSIVSKLVFNLCIVCIYKAPNVKLKKIVDIFRM